MLELAQGGVLPNIHQTLLPRNRKPKAVDADKDKGKKKK